MRQLSACVRFTAVSPGEAELILSLPNIHTAEGLRDRAILEVLYSTGIRRMEVVNLTRADLHVDRGVLAVRQGKGKKDRFVPVSERAMGWVVRYVTKARADFAIEPDPGNVFLEPTGQPLNPDRLSRTVTKYRPISVRVAAATCSGTRSRP